MDGDDVPKTAKVWRVTGYDGFESLKLTTEAIPDLGDSEVLVKIKGVSLNFRDIIIPQGKYPFHQRPNVIPASDGAGVVLAVGKNVTRFEPGDKVLTTLNQLHFSGHIDAKAMESGLGGSLDGTLRTVGAFDQHGLVGMPTGLNFLEAATLTCAGVTAWNALFGQPGRELMAGQWVLTQGAGGVSTFALQLAKMVGARAIALTSSDEKSRLLKGLGADHVINYRDHPDWSKKVRALTDGKGCDLVVDVVGSTTLKQSVESLKLEGTLSVVGFAGGESGEASSVPNLLDVWLNHYTARGITVGSRSQMEDMCRAIEANPDKLRPVVDATVFGMEDVKAAYEYLNAARNMGKVCITID